MLKEAKYLEFNTIAPIIVDMRWPEIPDGLKETCRKKMMERTIDDGMSTEYEVMVYLHTASLVIPFNQIWYDIYTYLFNKYHSDIIPEVIGKTEIDNQEKEELIKIRKWIYRQQVEYLRSK